MMGEVPVEISKFIVVPTGPQNLRSSEYVKNPAEPGLTSMADEYEDLVPKI